MADKKRWLFMGWRSEEEAPAAPKGEVIGWASGDDPEQAWPAFTQETREEAKEYEEIWAYRVVEEECFTPDELNKPHRIWLVEHASN